MDPDSGRPQFPVLYLRFPIIIACAIAVPAGDAVLQAWDVEPTGGARFLSIAANGLLIGFAVYLVFIAVRRSG